VLVHRKPKKLPPPPLSDKLLKDQVCVC